MQIYMAFYKKQGFSASKNKCSDPVVSTSVLNYFSM